jgi:hypothetical protein
MKSVLFKEFAKCQHVLAKSWRIILNTMTNEKAYTWDYPKD